jgi:spore maturation protein CgeB
MLCESKRIVVVGNPNTIHIGAHLDQAARNLKLTVRFCDTTKAFGGPFWLAKLNWQLRGHRPVRLREFGEQVVYACKEFHPTWMLSTGLAPVDQSALAEIGLLGVRRVNFLTDDPWNPAHRAPWFMKALPLYDRVFSTRRANLEELRSAGCQVHYLPFAYAPELHFPELPNTAEEQEQFGADVVFAGGADADRVHYITALVRAGFTVALYGGYWERFRATCAHARGHADPRTLRKAIGGAKVALCLVRRANRDGNSMRSFEVPAVGACMLVEDTPEHREIFGSDKEAVVYFCTVDEMIDKLRWLLAHDHERLRLAQASHRLIVSGRHTYKDRLATMLQIEVAS